MDDAESWTVDTLSMKGLVIKDKPQESRCLGDLVGPEVADASEKALPKARSPRTGRLDV